MRMKSFGVTVMLLAVLIAGCGAKNSDKVLGVWKSTDAKGGRQIFVEIAKGKMDIDGDAADIVLEDRDDKVSVRLAGRDEVVAVITVIDDKNIEINFSGLLGGKLTLVKSTSEERNAADHPPVEAIVGYWRSGDDDSAAILEIGNTHIAYGKSKADVTFSTKKEIYTVSGADNFAGTISRLNENTIEAGLANVRGTFTRTTKEDAEALAEKARAAVQPYLGMWRSEQTSGPANEFAVLEIGEDYTIRNGERKPATLTAGKDGLHVAYGRFDKLSLSRKDENTLTTGFGFGSTTYYRTSPDDLEKLRNPDIADFKGMWVLDSDASTYKALAIDGKILYRDGLKQTFDVASPRPNQLRLTQPGNKKFNLAWLSHAGPDRIAVINTGGYFGKYNSYYKRATKEEFAKALEGMVDLFGSIPGYWRSAEPVTDRGAYATLFVEYNVQGKKVEGLCDRAEYHFLDATFRNHNTDRDPRIAEGVIGHPEGDTSKSISLLAPDDGSRWYIKFTVLDVNTIEAAYAHGKPIKMLRSTKEDNDRLRAAATQKKK